MKNRWIQGVMIGLIFWLVLPTSPAICKDIIYLHDGTSITGEVIGTIPGDSFSLKRFDGTIRVFKMEDVWKVKFEEEEIYEDRIYLKDESIIVGTVIGAIPNETYRIRLQDKSVLTFRMSEVSRVELKISTPPTPREQPTTPLPPTTPPPLPPKKTKILIEGRVGVDFPSLKEINDDLDAQERTHSTIGKITSLERKRIKSGTGLSGSVGRKINGSKPEIELLARVEYWSYPRLGLMLRGEIDKDPHTEELIFELEYGISYVGFSLGIGLAFPITPTLLLNGEGFVGRAFGGVRKKEKSVMAGELRLREYELSADGDAFLASLGGGLEWRPSPNFSLITKAGYKGYKIENWRLRKGIEGPAKHLLPFDFSGPYLSGGIRLGF